MNCERAKKVVLHLLKTSVGASWALRQVRELVKLGHVIHVVAPAGGPLLSSYQEAGATVHQSEVELPVRAPWLLGKRAHLLRRLVSEIRPDIIHSHFVSTTLMMRLALKDVRPVPRIFQVPGPLHLEHSIFKHIDIRSADFVDHWLGSCRWTCKAYIENGVSPNRVGLCYYGQNPDEFLDRPCGQLRRELGIGKTTRIAGMVSYIYAPKRYLGQTVGIKGHEDFIKAISFARALDKNLIGVVVGGAWAGAEAYERKIRKLGQELCGDGIRFLGTRSDVRCLYPDFDVAVHPSHSENLGGAAESLASGIPTVATDVGGFPDIVIPGKTGWLVPSRCPSALSATILSVLESPHRASEMAKTGRELVRELLDVRRTASRTAQAYDDVLAFQR